MLFEGRGRRSRVGCLPLGTHSTSSQCYPPTRHHIQRIQDVDREDDEGWREMKVLDCWPRSPAIIHLRLFIPPDHIQI